MQRCNVHARAHNFNRRVAGETQWGDPVGDPSRFVRLKLTATFEEEGLLMAIPVWVDPVSPEPESPVTVLPENTAVQCGSERNIQLSPQIYKIISPVSSKK